MVDVAIVGAGPAGAWAAYKLARAGARVTVFDPSHPREKPCGGGVTGRALAMVSDTIVRYQTPVEIRRARFGQAPVPLDADALVVTSRTAFDEALLDAAERAGAAVERVRVVDLSIGASGVDVITTRGTR